jgi:septum formation protein
LASTSPRRIELLKSIGVDFKVIDPRVKEDITESDPVKYAVGNALSKTLTVASGLDKGIVIGADTIVVVGQKILGKPRDRDEARSMLESLAGRYHEVITGLAVIDVARNEVKTAYETTKVKIRDLSSLEIESYIATLEMMDKAGAYAAQGKGALLIERIEGCYYNVVGLPLFRLSLILSCLGFYVLKN